jgi:hypothetical protein
MSTHKFSRRSLLQWLGTSTLASSALALSGCTELFGHRDEPRVAGLSLARSLVLENTEAPPLHDFRLSFSVDFRVGGQRENAFNWVDGYPILRASLPGDWSWALATPSDFIVHDTLSPFGLDPDAFAFGDAQGESGAYSTTFVFRRPKLEFGDPWRIVLLYLAAEDDLGLVQIYRRVRSEIESLPSPNSLVPNFTGDIATVAGEDASVRVHTDATRLVTPIQSIEGFGGKRTPSVNPIYQEGLGAKYITSGGELVYLTSELESRRVQIYHHAAGEETLAQQLCGEHEHRQVRWRWCLEAPVVWHQV